MKPLVRDLLVCGGVALLGATGMSLVSSWFESLPHIDPALMAVAGERHNTPTIFLVVFAIIFVPAMVLALLKELRRRLDAWATITPPPDPRANAR